MGVAARGASSCGGDEGSHQSVAAPIGAGSRAEFMDWPVATRPCRPRLDEMGGAESGRRGPRRWRCGGAVAPDRPMAAPNGANRSASLRAGCLVLPGPAGLGQAGRRGQLSQAAAVVLIRRVSRWGPIPDHCGRFVVLVA